MLGIPPPVINTSSKNKVATTSTAAQDIVIGRIRSRGPRNIQEKKVGNDNAIGRATSWSSIQIILLNINTVRLDPADGNIAICSVVNSILIVLLPIIKLPNIIPVI